MSPAELQRTLTALHAELSQTTAVDDATRLRLREVIADLHRLAGLPDQPAPPVDTTGPSLTENLQNAVTEFEVRHPQLTTTLQQLIDRLAEIGI